MQQARLKAATWASPVSRHCAATNLAEVAPSAPVTSAEASATPCLQLSLLRTAVVSGCVLLKIAADGVTLFGLQHPISMPQSAETDFNLYVHLGHLAWDELFLVCHPRRSCGVFFAFGGHVVVVTQVVLCPFCTNQPGMLS
jgi:hypothetical protein